VGVIAPILAVVHLERVRRRSEVDQWVPASL